MRTGPIPPAWICWAGAPDRNLPGAADRDFRPEFTPLWIGQPHVTSLTINRLARRDIVALINGLLGNKPVLESIRQDIIERTDGVPLFVEEMAKAVLEAESEGEAKQTAAAVPSPARGALRAAMVRRQARALDHRPRRDGAACGPPDEPRATSPTTCSTKLP